MLYPQSEPWDEQRLRVTPPHVLRVMQAGVPDGEPVVVLHGGPGGGLSLHYTRFFHPEHWRVVLYDQRGAGASTPHGCLQDNNTWALVEDLEAVRQRLGIERWHVFGGSWGSTLALAYAALRPERIKSLCLRGVFLARQRELDWLYQRGASELFPDGWEAFVAPIPPEERGDLLAAYHRRLEGPDQEEQLRCARAWSRWEGTLSTMQQRPDFMSRFEQPAFALTFARIECHYFTHRAFFGHDGWLLEQIDRFRHVPAIIVQGRYDIVCPMRSAWDLHHAWPEADLRVVHGGHSATEPAVAQGLVEATDELLMVSRAR